MPLQVRKVFAQISRSHFPGGVSGYFTNTSVCLLTALFLFVLESRAQPKVEPTHRDVVYATVGGKELKLDLYLPTGSARPLLLVWVHGGAWRSGSKDAVPKFFVENGIATASLDFRSSIEGRFPAAVHDIKAAIRFLRAKVSDYGYVADRIGIGGASSGGHLAALVGLTNEHPELEGTVGEYLKESSEVHAIIGYYGASNLTSILSQSTPHGLSVREPALELLLGGMPGKFPEVASLASPVFHVDKQDPPLLLIHGDQDNQMPINQSHELEGKYRELGLDVHFEVLYGAGHGGEIFYSGEVAKLAVNFLRRTLRRSK